VGEVTYYPAITITCLASLFAGKVRGPLLGLAPGPILTGRLADLAGLDHALQWLPLPCLLSALAFAAMRRSYRADLGRMGTA
jgi:hypothetical protein